MYHLAFPMGIIPLNQYSSSIQYPYKRFLDRLLGYEEKDILMIMTSRADLVIAQNLTIDQARLIVEHRGDISIELKLLDENYNPVNFSDVGIIYDSKRPKKYWGSTPIINASQRIVPLEEMEANRFPDTWIKYHPNKVVQPSKPIVECPYCHSQNTTKISSFEKATSVALFGLFSNKRRYQWHCNNCNSDF